MARGKSFKIRAGGTVVGEGRIVGDCVGVIVGGLVSRGVVVGITGIGVTDAGILSSGVAVGRIKAGVGA